MGIRKHNTVMGRSLAVVAGLAGSTVGMAQTPPCPTDCPTQSRVTICYEAGRLDNYAAPFDSTSRRASFNAHVTATYPGIIKQFDDPTENRVLAHTFDNLPCGIISATLEVTMKAGNSLPGNDAIYLAHTGGGTYAWASPIASLPGAGGTWNPGQQATFSLNLASLPGGTNLLPLLNSVRALDFIMQDDTTVDNMRLRITVCPCDGPSRVYTVGVWDNMTPPTEPTSRRARLTALRTLPPFLWKDNDDCTIDRGWGHTFQSLPPGIVRADFAVLMQPCGNGNNDGIAFDLINDGGPETFTRGFNINALPGAGGVWTGNPLTSFFFNFNSTLPTSVCGTNMMGAFGDRTFDVYVQDDTAVDVARLRVMPCPPMRLIFGVPVKFTGIASPVFNAAERVWIFADEPGVPHNPEERSGVVFDSHAADGMFWDITYRDDYRALGNTYDMIINMQADPDRDSDGDGVPDGVSEVPASGMRMEHVIAPHTGADGLAFSLLDIGARCGESTVTLHNSQSGERLTLPVAPGQQVVAGGLEVMGWSWGLSQQSAYSNCNGCASGKSVQMSGPVPMFVGGVVFFADTIEFTECVTRGGEECDDGSDVCPPVYASTSWSWGKTQQGGYTSGGMGARLIAYLSRRGYDYYRGPSDHAKISQVGDDTVLSVNPSSVTVSRKNSACCLGSSGEDGIDLRMPAADEFSAGLTVICAGLPENCPPTQALHVDLHFTATLDGQSGRNGGSSRVSRVDSFFDIAYDVSLDGGNTLARIMVADEHGEVVGVFDAPAAGSLTAESLGLPSGCGKQAVEINGWRTACLWWDWRKDILINRPGRPPIVGRQIRILAAEPSVTFDHLERCVITAAGIDEFDVHSLRVIPVGGDGTTCYADFNQDGGIDGADVDAFFQAWENGDAAADVNEDGGIDGADVELFFEQWENGGC
ncbi:MAG: hypothetical protein KF864_03330 [Phycisphaeraceae bacterium]|nr:hypothetical protein [Phycisphaeraceae bacterium]